VKKTVGHLDGLIERPSGVGAEIEQQTLHALLRQVVEGAAEIAIRVLREVLQSHVPDVAADHEVRRDGRDMNLVTRDVERDELVEADTLEGHIHGGPLRTAQLADGLLRRPSLGIFAFDLRDDVTAPDSELVCGRSLEELRHGDVAIERDDLDA
jgi:hypothetical protein